MIIFHTRYHNASNGRVSNRKPVRWMEAESDDFKIIIDGSKTSDDLIIRVEANGIIYRMTDSLLEVMLGRMAEQFSNDYLNFHVYQKGDL